MARSDPDDSSRSGSVATVLRIVRRNGGIVRVELAYCTFSVAEWGTWMAMLVYAYARGGATASGVLATAMLVPAAVCAPVLASIGERHAPGRALVAGYVAQALTCGVVAVAMLGHVRSPVVYVLLAGPAIVFTMTRPTQAAFAPGLARRPEELAATNVVSGWIESLSLVLGPLAVGVVLSVGPPRAMFALGAAICALGAGLVLPLRDLVPPVARDESADASSGVGASIAFVRRDGNARTLMLLFVAQAAAVGALDVLYVVLARAVLHRGGNWAGYLNAAFGVGGVLAIVVTARLVGRSRLAQPLVLALGGWTIALFGLAAAPGVIGALALFATAGGSRATFDVTARTLLQRVARPDLLARVFGLLESLETAGLAVGSALAPALIALGGASAAFIGVAVLLPLVAVTAGRRLLDIDRHATVPVVEVALLRAIPMFALLPAPTLEALARALVRHAVAPGTDVITQGDEGDLFYVIADGEVDVIADGTFVTTLRRGDAVGEIALMYGVPRTATVRSRGEAHLYSLDRETFLVALTGNGSSSALAKGMADERLAELHALREEATAAGSVG